MTSRLSDDQTALIQSGDHLVLLYNSEEAITDSIVNFCRSALLRDEHCIYIKGDADDQAIIKKFNWINQTIDSGYFSVLESDSYSDGVEFDPDKMISKIKDLTKQALDNGYQGLSITGELSSALDYKDGEKLIVEYEWKLNDLVFDSLPVDALCRYNVDKFSSEMIVDVIQLHPYIMYKNRIYENPYYIQPEGYLNNEVAEYRVKNWLNNLDNFTGEKQRFFDPETKNEVEMLNLEKKLKDGVINSMLELLAIHDEFANNHSQNVADLAKKFAKYMGMNEKFITNIYYAGIVHDIGKILIPKTFINKEESLDEKEFEVFRQHPTYAYKALSKVGMSKEVSESIKSHHERWDGKGYPDGLRGDDIPFMARMLSIIDAYDAMTSDRPFRSHYSDRLALEEIFSNAGTQFDPYLASEFIKMMKSK